MRKVLLTSASIVALTSSAFATNLTYYPPQQGSAFYGAAPTVQAHVDLYGGVIFFGGKGSNDNGGVFGGAGRANVPIRDGWNVQIDAQAMALLVHDGSATYSYPTEFSGYAHLYKLTPGSHALGIFGGASWLPGPQVYTAGVEGQMYWQQFTLYGQASVSSLSVEDLSGHAFQLRGQGQWFANENTAVMGDVIWTSLDLDGSANVLTLAGTVMHRFQNTPIAGFGKVRWDQISAGGYSETATTLVAGVRVIVDQPGGTLRTSLQGVPMNVEPVELGFTGASMVSDVRLKRDIELVDHLANGLGLYRYRYLWSDTVYVGVMAQEVLKVVPEAVILGSDGYYRVNYALLGTSLMTWDEWLLGQTFRFAASAASSSTTSTMSLSR